MNQAAFGQLVRALRESRGITQRALAKAASTSPVTLNRIETGVDRDFRRSVLGRIIAAVGQELSPTEKQLEELYRLAGMTQMVQAVRTTEATFPSLGQFTKGLSPDKARCYWMLADMIDRVGVLPILKLLEGVAQIASMAVEPPVDSPRTFTHHGPKVQREGYVEEQITDYEVIPDTPAKPTVRKTGG